MLFVDNQTTSEWQNEDLLQSADCSIAKHVLDKAEIGKSNALCTYIPTLGIVGFRNQTL